MAKRAAGLLLFRRSADQVEVLLVHPGGPYWRRKDDGAWSIPKGEYEPGDDPLRAAEREFAEELGSPPPAGRRDDLGEVRTSSGKRIRIFVTEADFDCSGSRSNLAEVEWPPRSGQRITFPEVDRSAWFALEQARAKLVPVQRAFLDRLSVAGMAKPTS